jgi:hypothetical protein
MLDRQRMAVLPGGRILAPRRGAPVHGRRGDRADRTAPTATAPTATAPAITATAAGAPRVSRPIRLEASGRT